MNFRKILTIALLLSANLYYCTAQQYGIGLLPDIKNYRERQFLGFDTIGMSLGKEVKWKSSPKVRSPKFTPTFMKRYQDGKRMIDFYIGGSYNRIERLTAENFSPKPANFYNETVIDKKLYFSSTIHARLLSSKDERFAIWLGLNRSAYWEVNLSEHLPGKTFFSKYKTIDYGLKFSLMPTIQYRLNQKLFFYLRYKNPSIATLGVQKKYFDGTLLPVLLKSDIGIYLKHPKFYDNFQFGVRYFFKNTQKTEEIVLKSKKRPILSKTYWGVGVAFNLFKYPYFSRFFFNESDIIYKRYEYPRSFTIPFIIPSPALSLYKISDFGKRYQELYFTDASFSKKNEGIPHYYVKNDTIRYRYVAGRETYCKFILGYAYHKRVERMSKGFFNFYLGTNIDYTHITYHAVPNDKNLGFDQLQRTHGLRVSVTPSILWNIGERFNIETKWRPHFFIESAVERYSSNNPIDKDINNSKWDLHNYSNINLTPNFQLGLKYAFKVIKPKKIRYKKN